MRHLRLKSYIGYSSLTEGGDPNKSFNITEESLRSISSHNVYSHNI